MVHPVVTVTGTVYERSDAPFTDRETGEVSDRRTADVLTDQGGFARVKFPRGLDVPEVGVTVNLRCSVVGWSMNGQRGLTFTARPAVK